VCYAPVKIVELLLMYSSLACTQLQWELVALLKKNEAGRSSLAPALEG